MDGLCRTFIRQLLYHYSQSSDAGGAKRPGLWGDVADYSGGDVVNYKAIFFARGRDSKNFG